MRLLVSLLVGVVAVACQHTGKGSTGSDGFDNSSFGFELLLTKVEQLEAWLREQQQVTHTQISTLQERLQESLGNQVKLQQQLAELRTTLHQREVQSRFEEYPPLSKPIEFPDAARNDDPQDEETNDDPLAGLPSCEHATPTSGVYTIRAGSYDFAGYCEQGDHGAGWLVIQRRITGLENFNRTWAEYRDGFGEPDGDHWLGLEKVHLLTQNRSYEMMMEISRRIGKGHRQPIIIPIYEKRYDSFQLDSESNEYRIKALTPASRGDGLLTGLPFYTFDKVAKELKRINCNVDGGWWGDSVCASSFKHRQLEKFNGKIEDNEKITRIMIRPSAYSPASSVEPPSAEHRGISRSQSTRFESRREHEFATGNVRKTSAFPISNFEYNEFGTGNARRTSAVPISNFGSNQELEHRQFQKN